MGIDEVKHIRKDYGIFNSQHGKSKLYAIWSDGEKIQWNDIANSRWKKDRNLMFKEGDIVIMELDLQNLIL